MLHTYCVSHSLLFMLTSLSSSFIFFFFFQAEDGIRDWSVTGVQTCALPIFGRAHRRDEPPREQPERQEPRVPHRVFGPLHEEDAEGQRDHHEHEGRAPPVPTGGDDRHTDRKSVV